MSLTHRECVTGFSPIKALLEVLEVSHAAPGHPVLVERHVTRRPSINVRTYCGCPAHRKLCAHDRRFQVHLEIKVRLKDVTGVRHRGLAVAQR